MNLLKSKSIIGMLVFSSIGLLLIYTNKLTPTAVDFIKWLGGSFFLSRGMDNLTNVSLGDKG